MKKEVLIAIIIGFGLGLVITFGIWSANKAIKDSAPTASEPISVPEVVSPTPVPPAFSLNLFMPEDNSISDQEKIEVSGETAPEAIVVILYQKGEKILEADEEGLFTTEIDLEGGVNEIRITAYDQEGNEEEKTVTVVFSTAEI